MLGYDHILGRDHLPYTLVAVRPCVFYTLPRDAIAELMEGHPAVALDLQVPRPSPSDPSHPHTHHTHTVTCFFLPSLPRPARRLR
jgi:CRP-like cAMP-binding protein